MMAVTLSFFVKITGHGTVGLKAPECHEPDPVQTQDQLNIGRIKMKLNSAIRIRIFRKCRN